MNLEGASERRRRAALVVCETFVSTAPVDGAAFTEMAAEAMRETWCSSDASVAELERAQFDLGEGPTQEAFRTRRPLLIPDVSDPGFAARWPVLAERTAQLNIGAIFAIPMQIGALTAGVCIAYRRSSGLLTIDDLQALLRAVDAAALALLAVRTGTPEPEAGTGSVDGSLPRSVHQATGMLVVQLGVSLETALSRLRAHAFLTGRTLQEVADDIVERRLRLEPDPPSPIQAG